MNIEIHEHHFEYTPEILTYENSRPLDLLVAEEVLLLFNELAVKNKVPFVLFYGTLLGAVREHGFIKHDTDIDIVVNDENLFLDALSDFLSNGFFLVRYESFGSLNSATTIYSLKNQSVYIDVYIAYDEGKKYNLLGSHIPKSYLDRIEFINLFTQKFPVPKDRILILRKLYGKDWMIPIQNRPGDFKQSTPFSRKLRIIMSKITPDFIKNIIRGRRFL